MGRGMTPLPEPLKLKQLTAAQLEKAQRGDALIVDTRVAEQFASCHIAGALQIGLVGPFASWAAILIKPTQRILLIAEDASRALEAHHRLARVGLRDVIGYGLADKNQWRRQGIALTNLPIWRCDDVRLALQQGRPFRGSGWALEIGHMPFSASRRWLHAERGECLEAYVSGTALQHIAEHHQVPIKDVFRASAQASELSNHLREFVTNQVFAIATAIAVLSPETLVLGGGICEMKDFPKAQLVKELEQSFPFLSIGRPLDLRWASLGWRSVLHGATLLVRKEPL